MLARRAALHPDRAFLAERRGDGWRTLSYAQAHEAAPRIGAALLERGASATRPVMVLSENGITGGADAKTDLPGISPPG